MSSSKKPAIPVVLMMVVAVTGCSGTNLPDWMSSEEVDPIISPTESSQLSSPSKTQFTEVSVDPDVRPLSVEDLVKKSGGNNGSAGDKKPESSDASSWNEWENNLKLAPLEPPVDAGSKGSGDHNKKPDTAAESPPAKPDEKPKSETESRSDMLARLITAESDGGGPVSYKDIQDKLFPKAKTIGIPEPESRPATRPAVIEKTPVAVVAPETRPAEIGPVPVAGRSHRGRRLELNKDVVISGGAVQVNEEYITADGILDGLHGRMLGISRDLPRQQFEKKALEIISQGIHFEIQQRLVYAEAENNLVEQMIAHIDSEMDKALRRQVAEAGGSEEALRNRYRSEGITLESIMEINRSQMMISAFLQRKFYPRIVINRRTLWSYYNKHKAEFSSEKKVSMQIIAAPFSSFSPLKEFYANPVNRGKVPSSVEKAAARKAAQKQIRVALKALEGGEDFSAVAKARSLGPMRDDGGVWELMAAGNKREKKVEEAVFKMKEGERSGIIEEETGFYIVRAHKVQGGNVADFVEAQDEIEEKLRQDQYNKLRTDYFKKVYENATIVIGNDFIRRVVERAVERYW